MRVPNVGHIVTSSPCPSYWASLVFTGAFGYIVGAALAVILVFIFIVVFLFPWACHRVRGRPQPPRPPRFLCWSMKARRYSERARLAPLVFAALLLLLAIAGAGMGIAGCNQVWTAVSELTAFIQAYGGAVARVAAGIQEQLAGRRLPVIPESLQDSIADAVNRNLASIQNTAQGAADDAGDVQDIVTKWRITVLVFSIVYTVVAICLLGTVVVFALRRPPRKSPIIWGLVIVMLCTVIGWMMMGAMFASRNLAKDVCSAARECINEPGCVDLEDIIPCEGPAGESLDGLLQTAVSSMVGFINSLLAAAEGTRVAGVAGVDLPRVCDPFAPGGCAATDLSPDAVEERALISFVCDSNDRLACVRAGTPITRGTYIAISSIIARVTRVLRLLPGIRDVRLCNLAHATLNKFVSSTCGELEGAAKLTLQGYIILGSAFTVLMFVWTYMYLQWRAEAAACAVPVEPTFVGEAPDGFPQRGVDGVDAGTLPPGKVSMKYDASDLNGQWPPVQLGYPAVPKDDSTLTASAPFDPQRIMPAGSSKQLGSDV
eukprot:jgi/Mesvir1/24207/Mv10922-RA.1